MKFYTVLASFLFLFAFQPQSVLASLPVKPGVENTLSDEAKKARLLEIETRVAEIKKTDKSTLTASEKKALRKELRQMKAEARNSQGVYLSVGAIIIIILLLILIL